MVAIETYKVTVDGKEWRVPEDEVESFFHVCLFNNAKSILVELENAKRD